MYLLLILAVVASTIYVFRYPSKRSAAVHRSDLAKEVAHDIKNPLTALISNVVLLQSLKDPLTHKQNDLINKIHTCAEHVHTLLETFLDVTEHGGYKKKTFPQKIRLQDITKDTLSLLEPLMKEKSINVYDNVSNDCIVFADPTQCKQVFFNILHNAIKYCNKHDTVYINASEMNGVMAVTVRDSGPGFAPTEEGGHGLGLTIIENLVQQAGGLLDVQSTSEGTAVMFTLPAIIAAESKNENDHDNAPLYGKKLLLVQKEPSDMQSTLLKLGAIVNKADAVVDALHELSEKRFDMVLIDDDLELSTGYALAKVIKDDLNAKDTEVMILSRSDFDTQEASTFGVDGYISKSHMKKGAASWRMYPCK